MTIINQEYLRDESRSVGAADAITFARSEAEIRAVLEAASSQRLPVTIQGARTGLAGGAVPQGGQIINLSKMNRIVGLRHDALEDSFSLIVEPGVLLTEVRKILASKVFDTTDWSEQSLQALAVFKTRGAYMFSPDPTETSATLGGMVACNASGARSFYYGATRDHIKALRIMIMDCSILYLKRGAREVENGAFSFKTLEGKALHGALPQYPMPDVKNASGYYVKRDMDMIDLFIGAEGTLGVITEIELHLLPTPPAVWGVTVFFPTEECAVLFVRVVRGEVIREIMPALPRPVSIEYFNHQALDLLRGSTTVFGQLQELKPSYHTAIYVEFHGESDQDLQQVVLNIGSVIEACGGDEASTWVARTPLDMEKLLSFRHATPESVNMLIDQRRRTEPKLTKLGTDMAVPDAELTAVIAMYNRRLQEEGLEAVMFGHIGDNHIHVNILPRDLDDYLRGKALYLEWAREIIQKGGTVSAEHGIGKLKAPLLAEMYGSEAINKMRAIKRLFDPTWLLSPGNIFDNA